MRKIIRTDGTETELDGPKTMKELEQLLGFDCFSTVNLRHLGQPLQVMVIDDLGHPKGKPVNDKASQLYWANCYPGTTHAIVGDVAIVFDDDFA